MRKEELKKQLDDCKNRYKKHLDNQLSEGIEPDIEDFYLAEIEGKADDYDKLVAQRKEFIEYLEREIKEYTPNLRANHFDEDGNRDYQYINAEVFNKQTIEVLKEILSKYKEIIHFPFNGKMAGGIEDDNK